MIARHLIISGKVQGVSYRAWFKDIAKTLDLRGWVRNCSDGTVEAVIHGSPQNVEAMIKAAERGPSMAEVTNIKTADTEYNGLEIFEIRPTG